MRLDNYLQSLTDCPQIASSYELCQVRAVLWVCLRGRVCVGVGVYYGVCLLVRQYALANL